MATSLAKALTLTGTVQMDCFRERIEGDRLDKVKRKDFIVNKFEVDNDQTLTS